MLVNLFKKLWVKYFVQVDTCAKCPACGVRKKHKVLFHPAYEQLLHNCELCGAVWGETTLVQASVWKVTPVLQDEEPEKIDKKSINIVR